MKPRLTRTQRIILTVAAAEPGGLVVFGAGDRKGTRVIGRNDFGTPIIIAYSYPEHFLRLRGLLEPANQRHHYRITDSGRAALGNSIVDNGSGLL